MSEKQKKQIMESKTLEISVIDEQTIRDKIYVVRGVQVMLDFELAEIYGYETKSFNRQVKNNVEKFEGDDFMIQLTRTEFEEILRCKNFTSSWGGTRYLPYAFTEQGVYMLMTVLRGELAVRQSRALVRAFKAMKDYIVQNQDLIDQHNYLRLSLQMTDEIVFHCGHSSKDAGNKLCAITVFSDGDVKKSLHDVITKMLGNPELMLQ